jgi:hypothetical protein
MSSCGKTQPAIHAASCQSLEVASGILVTSRFKLYLHLFFVALVLRRCCALVLGEPHARQKAAAVEGYPEYCTPPSPHVSAAQAAECRRGLCRRELLDQLRCILHAQRCALPRDDLHRQAMTTPSKPHC